MNTSLDVGVGLIVWLLGWGQRWRTAHYAPTPGWHENWGPRLWHRCTSILTINICLSSLLNYLSCFWINFQNSCAYHEFFKTWIWMCWSRQNNKNKKVVSCFGTTCLISYDSWHVQAPSPNIVTMTRLSMSKLETSPADTATLSLAATCGLPTHRRACHSVKLAARIPTLSSSRSHQLYYDILLANLFVSAHWALITPRHLQPWPAARQSVKLYNHGEGPY